LGSSAGFVAWFLAEILPKEAMGGARVRSKLAIFGGCAMSFGGGYFSLGKKVPLGRISR
jgi:hypothetical protein